MEVRNTLFNHLGPRQLVLKRLYHAPILQVYRAFTDAKLLAQWWGPKGFSNPVCIWEAKPHGNIYVEMTHEGTAYPMGGTFHEIEELRRLLFTTTVIGRDTLNPHLVVLNAVKFTEREHQTELHINATIQHIEPEGSDNLKGMQEGWTQSLDKLEALLGNIKQL